MTESNAGAERGAALIAALLVLSFFALLGGALLVSTTLDVRIGDSYKREAQLLYMAEAGIEEAREGLRTSPATLGDLLSAAAGTDGVLSESRDLGALLAGDDVAFVNGGDRLTGRRFPDELDSSGGSYFVFLRNDPADGATGVVDTNGTVVLVAIAVAGNARKVIEATVLKGQFPEPPAALTLNGAPAAFQPAESDVFGISGLDSGGGSSAHAIGVLSGSEQAAVLAAIPDLREIHYPGVDIPASIGGIENDLDPRLKSPVLIESLMASIQRNATDVFTPAWNAEAEIGSLGGLSDYRVVVVNGDGVLDSGAGYGLLFIRGNLAIGGSYKWNGLVVVAGQGTVEWRSGASGQIVGGVFLARTREPDRTPGNPLGTLRATRGAVQAIFNGGGANAIQFNANAIRMANRRLPYAVVAVREY